MSVPRKTKFERLEAIYKSLAAEFTSANEPDLTVLGETYADFLAKIPSLLRGGEESPSRSQLASGMEQGLRDLGLIIRDYPEGPRRSGLAIMRAVIDSHYPDFLEQDRIRLARVLECGELRSEAEWYLVRSRVDELEGSAAAEDELSTLYRLLDEYAGATKPNTVAPDR